MTEQNQLSKSKAGTVVARSQNMAAALSSYARALTFENRSRRNLYRLAGLAPRMRDRLFSRLLIASFIVCFVLPLGASTFYYTIIASPRYSSEVRFIVRSSAPLLTRDRYAGETVEPKAKIVQDTAVLLNYLGSPAMVRALQNSVDFHQLFGRNDIDFFSRLNPNATQEKVIKYWNGKYSTWVNPKSGIVELEVIAFSPREAHDLLKLVLKLAEEQINRLNTGMWENLQVSAQEDVASATKTLEELRERFRDTQNQTGVFDIDLAADGILTVLTKMESDLAELKSRREALGRSVAEGSPRLADMDRQIAARNEQVKALRERTAGVSRKDEGNLAEYSTRFERLKLDLKMAESQLESAVKELEKVRLVSSLQLVYVDNFTDPTLPDDSKYPDIPVTILLQFLMYCAIWGAVSGGILFMRQKFD